MKKKLIVLLLCVCLISSLFVQPAYAMGAESIIVGGGAAAAGVTLTMPQVALLVAAGFGLVYTINHAEEIASGLNNALDNVAQNIANGLEELTYWKEQAAKGAIALASAPAWIKSTVKDWVGGLYESANVKPIYHMEYAANVPIPANMFWSNETKTFPVPTTVIRAGNLTPSGDWYSVTYRMVVIATTKFDGSVSCNVDGNTYYVTYWTSGTNLPNNGKPLAGQNLQTYEAVSQLPSNDYIVNNFTGSNWAEKYVRAWKAGFFATASVGSSIIIGGISNALGDHAINNINIPDLDIGGSSIFNGGHTGTFEECFNDTFTGLREKEITWEKYMDDVAVGTPSVSIPQADGTTLEYPITDAGVSDIPIDTTLPTNPPTPGNPSVEVPEGLEPFTISLKDFFPFCIPFDIADFINVLCAEPEAPAFEWEFPSVDGTTEKLTIDLSPFDSAAQLLRNMELLLFCIGLAFMTRNLIRG